MQVVAGTDHIGNLVELIGYLVGYFHPIFHVVVVLLEATHLLNMADIVGVIVVDIHGGILVVALDEQALTIHVGEPQRTSYLRHAFFPSPGSHGIQKRAAYLLVIDEVKPAEANVLTVPALVGTVIDDGCHASHHLAVTKGHQVFRLAEFEGGITVTA